MYTYTHKNYLFNKVGKLVYITGFSWSIEQIKLITDISNASRTVIYDPVTPWLGGTLSWEILTLNYDTNNVNFDNNDKLEIIIDWSSKANVDDDEYATPIRQTPQREFRSTFANVLASSWNSIYWTNIKLGTWQAISQAGGNGLITSGTTVNAETIMRSIESFKWTMTLRAKVTLSQRIVNNNFIVELVDIIGDALAITISSATAVTVTIPNNPFTSANAWQSMYLWGYTGTGTFVPWRYAIASVSGNNVTFTVAWFAVWSGTCSVFGWNYHHILYDGTVATNSKFDCQREGWASWETTATINTTASAWHIDILNIENWITVYADQLVASTTTTKAITERASRVENIPSTATPLYVQIRAVNGTVAPASTTTCTLWFVSIEDYVPIQASITSVRPQSLNSALPVLVQNAISAVISSGTITTVNTVSSVTSSNTAIPWLVADVASAALTTTTTTATVTPTFWSSYVVSIPVTVVTGTTPTLDVVVQESSDTGTWWENVYQFPRITTTGTYVSPNLKLNGNRVRYVQTVWGTTPSFTRSINRLQSSHPCPQYRQIIDRTIVANTLNSTTGSFLARGCSMINIQIDWWAMTTPPVLIFEGSPDWITWGNIATNNATYTPTASTLNKYSVWWYSPILDQYIRVRVSTAWTTATINAIYFTWIE